VLAVLAKRIAGERFNQGAIQVDRERWVEKATSSASLPMRNSSMLRASVGSGSPPPRRPPARPAPPASSFSMPKRACFSGSANWNIRPEPKELSRIVSFCQGRSTSAASIRASLHRRATMASGVKNCPRGAAGLRAGPRVRRRPACGAFGLQRPAAGVPGGGRRDGFGLGRNGGAGRAGALSRASRASLATVAAVRLGGAFLASGRLGSQSGNRRSCLGTAGMVAIFRRKGTAFGELASGCGKG